MCVKQGVCEVRKRLLVCFSSRCVCHMVFFFFSGFEKHLKSTGLTGRSVHSRTPALKSGMTGPLLTLQMFLLVGVTRCNQLYQCLFLFCSENCMLANSCLLELLKV